MGSGLQGISRTGWVTLVDQFGVPIGSSTIGENTSLNVNIEEVDIKMINILAHNSTGTLFTLTNPITAGDTAITLDSVGALAIGHRLEIFEDEKFQYTIPYITDVTGSVVTLDGPVDKDFTVAATVEQAEVNMAVSGSLASPVSYRVAPYADEIWHLTRMNFAMIHKSAATDDKFGSLDTLVNGLVIRQNTSLGGLRTLANVKSNQHFIENMYDVRYSAKAGGTNHGTAGRWSFEQRTGTVLRLDGAQGDYADCLTQDDLTAQNGELIDLQINFQGHVEDAA